MRGFVCALVSLLLSAAVLANPATQPAVIVIDVSRVPEMQALANRIQPLADEWYPRIAAMLPSDGFTPLAKVKIEFDPEYDGVAYAAGDRIVCAVGWFKRNPDDIGAVVHELVHVVQQYPAGDHPGWLTEGIADYIRWFVYEPISARPKPDPLSAKHSDSYRTSAHFLDYLQTKYDEQLIVKLNAACREGRYTDAIWQQLTGKTLEQLGQEWKASLAAQ
jgi:hypothetical protein